MGFYSKRQIKVYRSLNFWKRKVGKLQTHNCSYTDGILAGKFSVFLIKMLSHDILAHTNGVSAASGSCQPLNLLPDVIIHPVYKHGMLPLRKPGYSYKRDMSSKMYHVCSLARGGYRNTNQSESAANLQTILIAERVGLGQWARGKKHGPISPDTIPTASSFCAS